MTESNHTSDQRAHADPDPASAELSGSRVVDVSSPEFIGPPAIPSRAILGFAGAALIAVGAALGVWAMTAMIVFGSLLIIGGWPMLLGLRSWSTSRVVMTLTLGAGIPVALWGDLGVATVVAAGAVMAAFIAEMMRTDGRERLVENISGSVFGAIVMLSNVSWIAAFRWDEGTPVAICAAVALAITALVHAFETRGVAVLGCFNGTLFALAAAYILDLPLWVGGVVGIVAGLAYMLTYRAVRNLPRPSPRLPGLARAWLPFSALGVIVYVVTGILV